MGNRALTPISRAYTAVLYGMAWSAGALMVAMMAMIVADVALRNLGFQSSAHFFTFTEYFLLLIPLFGAPWLVREKGHIYIELLVVALPDLPATAIFILALIAVYRWKAKAAVAGIVLAAGILGLLVKIWL